MMIAVLILMGLAAEVSAAAARPMYAPDRLALLRSVTEVRLSPQGHELAFISDLSGALEVWTVPAGGGWPQQLSSLGEQVSQLRYTPQGDAVLFASDFGGDERADLYLVPAGGGAVENLTRSTQAESSPAFSADGRKLAYTSDPDKPFLFQLMVMDLATRKIRQLTREPVNVHFPVWSPNSRMIAVTRSGDDQKGDLLLVDPSNGVVRIIAPPVAGGILIPEEFSSNGEKLLCRALNARGFLQLYLLDAAAAKGSFIGPGEWDIEEARMHYAAGIVFTRNEGGQSSLYRLGGPDKAERLLPAAGHIAGFDLDAKGQRLAYLWEDSTRPPDAWLLDFKKGGKPVPVTRSLLGGIEPNKLARARLINYFSSDNKIIHAFLLLPEVPRLGEPPPAVVIAHGGPDYQIFDEFKPLAQSLAEAGFAVLMPNFRGSSGYGKEFLDSNNKDWGGKDLDDIVAGVRRLASNGQIDPKRVGITGGSYGGFMTLTALVKSTSVWAAGVEAYGMPDLAQDYELSGDRFKDWYATEMGTPKTHAALFHERSPIHFIDRIVAPLLIFQGANDTNVPPAESDLIYQALKKRSAPVEMVVYSDEGHGFTKRVNRVDYYTKTVEFFKKHLAAAR